MDKIYKYYHNLVNQYLEGQLQINVKEEKEGCHDCVIIDFDTNKTLKIETIEYFPSIIIFYQYSTDMIAKREYGKFEDAYSFTNQGYGKGLYLDCEDSDTNKKNLFKSIIKIINDNLKRKSIKDLDDLLEGYLLIKSNIDCNVGLKILNHVDSLELIDINGIEESIDSASSNFIQPFSSNMVCLTNCFTDEEEINIANIHGYILRFNPFFEKDDEFVYVCDSLDGNLYELTQLVLNEKYMDEEQDFFIYIDQIFVEPQYRRYSVAETMLKNIPHILEQKLNQSCGNMFWVPTPLECESEDFQVQLTHLTDIYKKYGFKEVENSNCMWFDYVQEKYNLI